MAKRILAGLVAALVMGLAAQPGAATDETSGNAQTSSPGQLAEAWNAIEKQASEASDALEQARAVAAEAVGAVDIARRAASQSRTAYEAADRMSEALADHLDEMQRRWQQAQTAYASTADAVGAGVEADIEAGWIVIMARDALVKAEAAAGRAGDLAAADQLAGQTASETAARARADRQEAEARLGRKQEAIELAMELGCPDCRVGQRHRR